MDEVAAYCQERKNGLSAEQFCDYYQARGWRVGKDRMKDWRAAVRTWERNAFHRDEPKNDGPAEGLTDYAS